MVSQNDWPGAAQCLTKREILTIVGALIIICGLIAWGTVFAIREYLIGTRNDPLARAGGLSPSQAIGKK
jgi:hypothetical protein